jgi:hypothetical protein
MLFTSDRRVAKEELIIRNTALKTLGDNSVIPSYDVTDDENKDGNVDVMHYMALHCTTLSLT